MEHGLLSPAPFGTLLAAFAAATSGRRRRTARARLRWLMRLFKRTSPGRKLAPAPLAPIWA